MIQLPPNATQEEKMIAYNNYVFGSAEKSENNDTVGKAQRLLS